MKEQEQKETGFTFFDILQMVLTLLSSLVLTSITNIIIHKS
jgi:competence protein ComGC